MRILLAQINPTIGDIKGNSQKIIDAIELAKKQKIEIVLFPEMVLTGYPPEDFLLFPHFINDAEKALEKILPHCQGITAIVGSVRINSEQREKRLYNTAAILQNGRLLGFQDKRLLPTYDVFDERRYFEPGTRAKLWQIGNKNVAITICEDMWQNSELLQETAYRCNPIEEIAQLQPDLVLNLSASPFSLQHAHKRISVCERAVAVLKCPLLLCNQVGGNDSLIFDGYSLAMNEKGQLLALANGYAEDFLVVDLQKSQQVHHMPSDPSYHIHQALVLGIRDYFKKSGFSQACLGLSGGIDSAVVACLAVAALGKENVLAVLMPSRYSSPGSLADARKLVKNLGVNSQEISVEEPFGAFLNTLAPIFADKPSDTTEENLQARIRGMLLMALSNKFGYIVLSTGNKSELALGYATLYGDMCGGLAVISDLTKRQVYAIASWINKDHEIIPHETIAKPPSAELRPNQRDADSLPDYDIVDNVVQAYVEEHESAEKISQRLGYALETVQWLVKRIHANEYKRRQSAPGLRISEKAFTVGRRFPIVQKYI